MIVYVEGAGVVGVVGRVELAGVVLAETLDDVELIEIVPAALVLETCRLRYSMGVKLSYHITPDYNKNLHRTGDSFNWSIYSKNMTPRLKFMRVRLKFHSMTSRDWDMVRLSDRGIEPENI